jgi:mannose/fructose/N-acetylgalactosamine-specific phosphotransferase system component IID
MSLDDDLFVGLLDDSTTIKIHFKDKVEKIKLKKKVVNAIYNEELFPQLIYAYAMFRDIRKLIAKEGENELTKMEYNKWYGMISRAPQSLRKIPLYPTKIGIKSKDIKKSDFDEIDLDFLDS